MVYIVDHQAIVFRFQAWTEILYFFSSELGASLRPTQLPIQWAPWVLGRESDNSLSYIVVHIYSIMVRNVEKLNALSFTHLQGVVLN
jgi:hypothetical protein